MGAHMFIGRVQNSTRVPVSVLPLARDIIYCKGSKEADGNFSKKEEAEQVRRSDTLWSNSSPSSLLRILLSHHSCSFPRESLPGLFTFPQAILQFSPATSCVDGVDFIIVMHMCNTALKSDGECFFPLSSGCIFYDSVQ